MESHQRSTSLHFLVYLLLLVIGFGAAGLLFYIYPIREKTVVKTVEAQHIPKLPPDVVKLSECVPHMGEHWVQLKNLPRGPFYMTYNNKVIGVEYMFRTTEIPGNALAHMSPQQSLKYITDHKLSFSGFLKDLIPYHYDWPADMQVKSWYIGWSPAHVGLLEPHYDLHYWNITKEELENVCPNAPLGSELPPDMATQLKKLGVPIP